LHGSSAYRDRLLAIEEGRLTIRRYYFPLPFPKRIPLGDVREAAERPIGRLSGQLPDLGIGRSALLVEPRPDARAQDADVRHRDGREDMSRSHTGRSAGLRRCTHGSRRAGAW